MGTTRTIYISSEKDLQLYNQAKKNANEQDQTISRYLLDALKTKIVREGNEETHSSLDDIGLIKKLNVFFDKEKNKTDLQLQEAFISPRDYILPVTNENKTISKKTFKGVLIAAETTFLGNTEEHIMIFQTIKNNIVVYGSTLSTINQTFNSTLHVYDHVDKIPNLNITLKQKIQLLTTNVTTVEKLDI